MALSTLWLLPDAKADLETRTRWSRRQPGTPAELMLIDLVLTLESMLSNFCRRGIVNKPREAREQGRCGTREEF